MKTYNNLCAVDSGLQKNTGFKKPDCLESLLDFPLLSNGFAFDSVQDFETVQSWKDAIAAKSIVPLFDVYEVADASTEDTFYETGKFKRRTEKGKEIITAEMYLSVCAYAALKSYETSAYTEIFEYNQEGDYMGVYDADGVRVRGRKCQITVERRKATKDKVAHVLVEIVYDDKNDILNAVLTKSDLKKDDLHGVYDVNINIVSASASSIKFNVTTDCSGDKVTNLVDANIILLDNDDEAHTRTFVAADSNGDYELTGTGFATGFTVGLNGVIVQPDIMYEDTDAVAITVT